MINEINGKKWMVILPAGLLITVILAVAAAARQFGRDHHRLENVEQKLAEVEGHAETLSEINENLAAMKSDIKWIMRELDNE